MAERWAVVTGAAGGIGRATCQQLATQGFGVFMLDLQDAALVDASDRLRAMGSRTETMCADATTAATPEEARARVETLGRVDAVVNLAGGSGPRPIQRIEELDDELWDHVVALNVTSTFRFCRAFVPGMRERRHGRIVNMSSTLARS